MDRIGVMGGAKRNDGARYVDWYVEGRTNRGFDVMKSGESVRSIIVFSSWQKATGDLKEST